MTADTWSPWSCEAEQALLGCLLLDSDALAQVAGLVEAASFWHPPHRAIFSAIARLTAAAKPADVITVFDTLRDAGQADDVGGLVYLKSLTDSVPSAKRAAFYAAVVADKAQRRALLAAVDGFADVIRTAESADEAFDRIQTALAGTKRANGGNPTRHLGEVLTARTAFWEDLEAGHVAPGIPTGLSKLDEALAGGIKPGRVIVLAARPSVGKTSLATQLALHVGRQGHPVLALSQEMPADELADRAAAHLGSISLSRISTGRLQPEDWKRAVEAADTALAMPVYVDDSPALTLLQIRAKARDTKRKAGGRLALVVVDYLQLCGAEAGKDRNRHHQIEAISRGLKTLAKELDTTLLVLSQLNRGSQDDEPELHHLKESGAIEEDADTVVLLHPMGKESEGRLLVLAKVAKNRGGRRGRLAMAFNGGTQTWEPSAADVSNSHLTAGANRRTA